MQVILLSIDSIEVVTKDTDRKIGILTETSVAHKLRILKLYDSCNILRNTRWDWWVVLINFICKHLSKVNLISIVALAAKDDDVQLADLCTCSWISMKEVRIWDDDRLPFCLFQRNCIALAHVNIFDAAWLILGLILGHTIENEDMSMSYLTNRCIASWLVQRGQCQPLILHDVIDLHCICVFELCGRSYRATGSQNEVILQQTKRRVESLHLHWRHVFVIQILIQPEQVP